MNRRMFLKAIATIGMAATFPTGLAPAWKQHEEVAFHALTYRGIPVRFDPYCSRDTIYFVNPRLLRH